MSRAEAGWRALGCHGAWLDTSSPEARRFYLALGYVDFAFLANGPSDDPPEHCRWFMKKVLTPAG